jgi:signal transduction histidine kinase
VDNDVTLKTIRWFRKIFLDNHLPRNLQACHLAAMATDHNELVDLVRRVRHDANNPLTAALGHVQLLLDDPAVTNDEVRDSLRVVESELRRLTGILRQLNEIK